MPLRFACRALPFVAILLLSLQLSGQATTTIDFEGVVDGASITTQYANLNFTNTTVASAGIRLNELDFPAHSGKNVASDSSGPITITFNAAINSFSAYFTHSGAITIAPFAADGTALAITTTTSRTNTLVTGDPGSIPNEQLTTSSIIGMAKIVITGSPSGGSFAMDDLSIGINSSGGTVSGIVNAASFASAMSAGGIGTIFGIGLGSSALSASAIPLPTTLGQTSVTVNGEAAPLYYIGPGQINFEIPTDLVPGTYPVVVTVNGNPSQPFNITLAATAPAIFVIPGGAQAASLNLPSNTVNGPAAGALPGSYISMFLTGGGAVAPAIATGAAALFSPLSYFTASVSATIGDLPAPVTFAGLTPTLVALGQVNLQIPNLPPGQYPVVITIGGVASNTATIYVGSPQ